MSGTLVTSLNLAQVYSYLTHSMFDTSYAAIINRTTGTAIVSYHSIGGESNNTLQYRTWTSSNNRLFRLAVEAVQKEFASSVACNNTNVQWTGEVYDNETFTVHGSILCNKFGIDWLVIVVTLQPLFLSYVLSNSLVIVGITFALVVVSALAVLLITAILNFPLLHYANQLQLKNLLISLKKRIRGTERERCTVFYELQEIQSASIFVKKGTSL